MSEKKVIDLKALIQRDNANVQRSREQEPTEVDDHYDESWFRERC